MSIIKAYEKNRFLTFLINKNLLKISLFLLASVSSLTLLTTFATSTEDLGGSLFLPVQSRVLSADQIRLLRAVEEGKDEEVEDLLLNNQALIDSKDRKQNSLLHLAIQKGHEKIVGFLLEEQCDIKVVNRYGRTPLHEAALKADKNTIERLLKKGVNVNAQDQEGNTALHIAIDQQSLDSVLLLMNEISLNPLIKNTQGKTAGDLIEQQIRAIDKDASVARTLKSHFSRFSNVRVRGILEQAVNLTSSHYDLAAQMMQQNKRIFFSYCWNPAYSTKPMVDDLENILKDLGITNYYRDVREEEGLGMTVGTHIETFMKNAQEADAMVIFLNDAYLRSRNCMYEFLQVWDEKARRISFKAFVIFHPDFTTLYKGPTEAISYVEYWEEVYRQLKNASDLPTNREWNLREQQFVHKISKNITVMIEQLVSYIQADYLKLRSTGFKDILRLSLSKREEDHSKQRRPSLSTIPEAVIDQADLPIINNVAQGPNLINDKTVNQYRHLFEGIPSKIDRYKYSADKNNDVRAQYTLGAIYAGEPEGLSLLGNEIVEPNFVEAFNWYSKAAKQNYSPAQNQLGNMFRDGKGVQRDEETAIKWYTCSAELGNGDGRMLLATMYKLRGDRQLDSALQFNWYKKACEQYEIEAKLGNALAQYCIGTMYERGTGVIGNKKISIQWYELAAKQGLIEAQQSLEKLREASEKIGTPSAGMGWSKCSIQ